MKNYIVYLLVMIVVICGCPVPSSAVEEPKLYAKAAVLMDADTGRVLYGRAPDEALPMASTTKIMTLILALEYGNPDDVVTVSSYAARCRRYGWGFMPVTGMCCKIFCIL